MWGNNTCIQKRMHNKQYVIDWLTFMYQFTQAAMNQSHAQINLTIVFEGTDQYEYIEKFNELKTKVIAVNNGFFSSLKFLSYTQGTGSNFDLDQFAQ